MRPLNDSQSSIASREGINVHQEAAIAYACMQLLLCSCLHHCYTIRAPNLTAVFCTSATVQGNTPGHQHTCWNYVMEKSADVLFININITTCLMIATRDHVQQRLNPEPIASDAECKNVAYVHLCASHLHHTSTHGQDEQLPLHLL